MGWTEVGSVKVEENGQVLIFTGTVQNSRGDLCAWTMVYDRTPGSTSNVTFRGFPLNGRKQNLWICTDGQARIIE